MDHHRCAASVSEPRGRGVHRRGIAMMLVMVALLVTTVLVGAALTSRDNAPNIGENAASAAEATWSAESAVNFAVGAIAQAGDLDALLAGDSTLSSTMQINGATVCVTVTNMAGDPPTDADRELIVRATAQINGVDKVVEKHVTRMTGGEAPDAADPYLSEFAVFATQRCTLETGTKVGVWDLSPEAGSSMAMAKIGMGYSNAGDLSLDAGATISRVGLYCDEDASLALEAALSGRSDASEYWKVPLDIPTVPGALPFAINALPDVGTDVRSNSGATVSVAAGGKYANLEVDANSKVVLDQSVSSEFQFEDVSVRNGSALVIRGNVSVGVMGKLTVDSGDIVLEDDAASVTFYLAGDVEVNAQAKVGINPADALTLPGVVSAYVAPARVELIALSVASGGSASPNWDLDNSSLVIGMLHNPLGRVRIRAVSSLCGHAVAGEFLLQTGSKVVYCPKLDSHLGYTTPTGPLYDAAGDPIPELLTILYDVASTTTNAESFINKFYMDYNAAKMGGDLELIDISTTTKTVTETLNLGGLAIY